MTRQCASPALVSILALAGASTTLLIPTTARADTNLNDFTKSALCAQESFRSLRDDGVESRLVLRFRVPWGGRADHPPRMNLYGALEQRYGPACAPEIRTLDYLDVRALVEKTLGFGDNK